MRGHGPSDAPDKHGDEWGGRKPIDDARKPASKTSSHVAVCGVWSLKDHASARRGFPGLLAGHKDNGRAPTGDGEMTG